MCDLVQQRHLCVTEVQVRSTAEHPVPLVERLIALKKYVLLACSRHDRLSNDMQ